MPAQMTFTSLLEDARRYLERGGPTDPIVYDQLPRLVTLAERRIARELKIQGFLAAVTTTLQSGVAVYQKPDLWRDTISMNYGTGTGNNTRNFLLTEFAPNLLLYGTLVEATPFVKDDERVQLWQSYYDRALAALNGEDLQKILDRSVMRRED